MNAVRHWFECRFVRSALGAYLDRELAHEAARIERHLAQCGRCRALARALAAQAQAIEGLAADEDPRAGFVDRVMQRIASADSHPTARPWPQPRWRPSSAVASAAAGLLVIAAAAMLWIALSRPSQLPRGEVPPPTQPSKVAKLPPALSQPGSSPAVAPQSLAASSTADKQQLKGTAPASAGRGLAEAAKSRGQRPRAPSPPAETAAAGEAHRTSGRSYEDRGLLDQALREYAAAQREGGSQMARLDAARVYEKTGQTAEAVDELTAVAFADLDENRWEPLPVN